jgi:DNA adenine methylase
LPANKTDSRFFPAKPFLKWAGSKRQLLPKFIDLYTPELKSGKIKNYYEPFMGSGAVFFDIAQRYQIDNAFLYDVNEDLVLTYRVIQSQVCKLIDMLTRHGKKYLALNKIERVRYFYEQRMLFNQQRSDKDVYSHPDKSVNRAAQLIFLNRTCFNGLFRVNSKGEFNTPMGDYANPSICDQENLLVVSDLLSKASIRQADFTQVLKDVKPAAFIYFDPPYRPLTVTANFTAYSKSAFTDREQLQLAGIFRQLDKKKVAIMLSNSDTADGFFDDLYKGFHIKRIPARRLINADASKRGAVNEIVITNYPV